MKRTGDFIRIIECAYDLDGDDGEWLLAITRAAERCLEGVPGLGGFLFHAPFPASIPQAVVAESAVELAEGAMDQAKALLARAPASVLSIYDRTRCTSLSSYLAARADLDPTGMAFYQTHVVPRDTIDIVGRNPDGSGVALGRVVPEPVRMTAASIAQWERVASHLAAGLRLRRALASAAEPRAGALEDGEAILDPDGALQHATPGVRNRTMRAALRTAARSVDRARGGLRSQDPQAAVELWKGLVAGRWSLVDRFDSDGRRFYVAHRNDPHLGTNPLALSEGERQAVAFAAMGDSDKLIAYKLGLSRSAVASRLSSARKKLGLRSRADFISLASVLRGESRPGIRTP